MDIFVYIGLVVFVASLALGVALLSSEPAPDWLEEEEYRRNHWYK